MLVANREYFAGYLLISLGGLIFLLLQGKASTFLYLNPYHVSPLDVFFTNYTYLGDGIFSIVVILWLAYLRRFDWAIDVLLAFLLSALFAQIFKNLFSMPRPRTYFNNDEFDGPYKHFIEGVTLKGHASFPSGHSTSIFALVTMLAILVPDKRLGLLFLLGAVVVGYSRIYLGQHFLPDVLAGSFLGTLTAILIYVFLSSRISAWTAKWKTKKPRDTA
jgi:membrane-associated phospholipid phosphatase